MKSDAFKVRLAAVLDGVSNREFASRCGLSEGTIRRYLRGEAFPPLNTLEEMARAGGVPMVWLAAGEGPMRAQEQGAASADMAEFGAMLQRFNEEYSLVPRYDVEVSAGGGSMVENDRQPIESLAFRSAWLKRMGLVAAKLALVTTNGDSMEPTLADGDLLLIDLRQTVIVDGAIHVLRNNGDLLVKRLQRGFGDQVIVSSDNTIYRELETTVEKLNVVGRVIWRGGRM